MRTHTKQAEFSFPTQAFTSMRRFALLAALATLVALAASCSTNPQFLFNGATYLTAPSPTDLGGKSFSWSVWIKRTVSADHLSLCFVCFCFFSFSACLLAFLFFVFLLYLESKFIMILFVCLMFWLTIIPKPLLACSFCVSTRLRRTLVAARSPPSRTG